ncbi:MAG: 4Fe-4S cluster-binding domain-containing protein [Ruminococcaceae bacterium]|nr:4Fe-4S cluster-binding domain-containing protein [Oscillospiraceae bacterium]
MPVCYSCPRKCGVLRQENINSDGFCKMPYNAVIARAALHFYEEPPICSENGSGAIFFSGCSLRCMFCQNFEISSKNYGKAVSKDRFIEIMKELESKGADNINLVNPSHFIPFIKDCLTQYKPKIPVVYNSGGYDRAESIRELDGLIDIYLPDFKYISNELSLKYSGCKDYVGAVTTAIPEMFRQTGESVIENGLMKRGLIIRHLVLPANVPNSLGVLNWISENMPKSTYISLMSQYTPCGRTYKYKELNRRVMTAEYQKVVDEFLRLGFTNGFMQQRNSADEQFIPEFDLTGV